MDTTLQRLASVLDLCQKQQQLITYLELSDRLEITPPKRIQQISELLEHLMELDAEQGRPLRAALVVSKTGTDLPAPGFFDRARELGVHQHNSDSEYHRYCLDQLFSSSD